jgi:hypothetical protein
MLRMCQRNIFGTANAPAHLLARATHRLATLAHKTVVVPLGQLQPSGRVLAGSPIIIAASISALQHWSDPGTGPQPRITAL